MFKNFPQTRYQGSKYKLLPFLYEHISKLQFNSALDLFSGTSSVSYLFKSLNKQVYSNDFMPFNAQISKSFIENNSITLSNDDILFLLNKHSHISYQNFISQTFKDCYYLDAENEWLDVTVQNILALENPYKKALAFWAIYQSCLIKRPYNLFHRKNLHIRTADVKRSFGNKTTWDKPFDLCFKKFIQEANNVVFDNHQNNLSLSLDACSLNYEQYPVDLVYIDPPYIPKQGSITTYSDFYHFLNGLTDYHHWHQKINYQSKNFSFHKEYSIWEDKKNIFSGFQSIFKNFQPSTLVISYRNDGIPSIDDIITELHKYYSDISTQSLNHQYVLSSKKTQEILIIAKN